MKRNVFLVSVVMMMAMPWTASRAQSLESLVAPVLLNSVPAKATRIAAHTPYQGDADDGNSEEHAFEPGATWDCGFSPEGGANPRVIRAINEVRPRPGKESRQQASPGRGNAS